VTTRPAPVVLRVRVIPRARANALTVAAAGTLRARLIAPPVEGAANRALLDLLARELGLKRGDLTLVRGERGRDKLVTVQGPSAVGLEAKMRLLAADDVDNTRRRG
jgi:uncharacterized protein YggU (UPF0235/DUF167 family)